MRNEFLAVKKYQKKSPCVKLKKKKKMVFSNSTVWNETRIRPAKYALNRMIWLLNGNRVRGHNRILHCILRLNDIIRRIYILFYTDVVYCVSAWFCCTYDFTGKLCFTRKTTESESNRLICDGKRKLESTWISGERKRTVHEQRIFATSGRVTQYFSGAYIMVSAVPTRYRISE